MDDRVLQNQDDITDGKHYVRNKYLRFRAYSDFYYCRNLLVNL